ncbi:MAG: hypothetical protein SNJ78_07690 [Spirochaetales bacterium]
MALFQTEGVRDTDDILYQKIPFCSKYNNQRNVIGRFQFDGMDIPISVEGVTGFSGDIIMGDGDRIIVVPLGISEPVAYYESSKKFL